MHLLECRKTSHYFPAWKKNEYLLLGISNFSAHNCAFRKSSAASLVLQHIQVLLVLCTSRVQQNPTWNRGIMCRIPPLLLHHCSLSSFLRQPGCVSLSHEGLQQWDQARKIIGMGFGRAPFKMSSFFRRAAPSANRPISGLKHKQGVPAWKIIGRESSRALSYATSHQLTMGSRNKLNPIQKVK